MSATFIAEVPLRRGTPIDIESVRPRGDGTYGVRPAYYREPKAFVDHDAQLGQPVRFTRACDLPPAGR